MNLNTFIVSVFTIIDDWFQNQNMKLRSRGPQPLLYDSEVLTIEVVGAFLGMSKEKDVFLYFRRHYADYFPNLRCVHRTTYTRQSANLWFVKGRLWQDLLQEIIFDPAFSIVDSMPVPVCRFARAYRCHRLCEISAFGYDEVARQRFFGIRAHLQVCWPGVIVGLQIAAADTHELHVAEEMMTGASGWTLGDRNYWSPHLRERLQEQNMHLLSPFKSARHEGKPWPTWLKHKRYRIETVFSQLVERFQAKQVWARDAWHFCSRWLRRILSHTIAVYLCQQNDLTSLRFAELVVE